MNDLNSHSFLTRKEAAFMLRCSLSSVDRGLKRGIIRRVKFGRKVLISIKDLYAILSTLPKNQEVEL
jgi:excisionase family DNA binding protein